MAASFTSGVGENFIDVDHAKYLAHCLNDYRKQGKLCDVMLIVPPKEFCAHRNIACAASPYILERLTVNNSATNPTLSLGSRLEIGNVRPEVFGDILNFMYIGEICVGEENVRKLIAASDILQMKSLKEISCRFYEKRLCAANCLSIAALADEFNCETLRAAADKFILENFLDVCKYNEFQTLSHSHLISILQSDDINVDREEQVYSAAMNWVHHDLENRKVHLPNILKSIRLLLLSKYFIIDVLEQDETLISDSKCSQLVSDFKSILTLPDRKHIFGSYQKLRVPRLSYDLCEIVIACSGNQEHMSSNEVLCYVPFKDFWYPLAPLSKSRYQSASVVLNNELYCIGGKFEGLSAMRSIERYSFSTDRWIESAPFPQAAYGHVCCVFNGEIYVIGGSADDKSSNAVMKYSTERSVWQEVKHLLVPRKLASVAVHNQLYVIGGYGPQGEALASVERYDPYQNEWAKTFPMNSPRANASACCIGDNIFVFGGEYAMWSYYRSSEVFNVKTDEWRSIADFSVPRSDMGIACHHENIYLVGGMVSADGADQYGLDEEEDFVDVRETNLVECYNTNKGTWSKVCSLPVATAGANCAMISTAKSILSQRCGF